MKIGIASPISVNSLQAFLYAPDKKELKLGLGGTAVNIIIMGLIEKGHSVSVYTLDWSVKRDCPVILKGERLTIYIGQFRHFNKLNKLKVLDFMRFESEQIRSFIMNDEPDIVNAHWSYEYATGAIKADYPHLITFRDDARTILKITRSFYRGIRFLMDAWVKRNGKWFNVNSPYLQKQLSGWKNDIPIIPNPINSSISNGEPKKITTNTKIKIISILTGWGGCKNPETGLVAFQLLRKILPKVELEYYLYGPGYEKGEAGYKWCVQNKLIDQVHFCGMQPHALLMKELVRCHILLHPSIEESFGNTLIEAMQKGVPVVAGKNAGAVPWVLNEGKNGVLVDITTPQDIARGLKKLIEDKKLYDRLSSNGISYVDTRFSREVIAKKYIDLYRRVLNATH